VVERAQISLLSEDLFRFIFLNTPELELRDFASATASVAPSPLPKALLPRQTNLDDTIPDDPASPGKVAASPVRRRRSPRARAGSPYVKLDVAGVLSSPKLLSGEKENRVSASLAPAISAALKQVSPPLRLHMERSRTLYLCAYEVRLTATATHECSVATRRTEAAATAGHRGDGQLQGTRSSRQRSITCSLVFNSRHNASL
jgi:hypothetical protein